MKFPKYRNRKMTVDGITFDSKGEYQRWHELQMLERSGNITELERQVVYIIAPSVTIDGRKKPMMKFTLDFRYIDENNKTVIEDWKSEPTAKETSFKMRRHLLKSVHNLDVVVRMK